MRPRCFLAAASLVASAIVASSAHAQTVDDILARNLQALGGRAALDRVQSVRQTSRLVLPGSEATIVVYSKRPNLVRQELMVAGDTAIEAYDGSVAWAINRVMGVTGPTALSGTQAEAIRNQSGFDGILASARARGDLIDLVGAETLRGRSVIHLRLSATDHHRQVQCYVDAETYLEVRTVTESRAGRLEQDLLDYRPVEGVMMPFTIKTTIAGRPVGDVVVSKVEMNVPIDDAIFKMPRDLAGATGTAGAVTKVTAP